MRAFFNVNLRCPRKVVKHHNLSYTSYIAAGELIILYRLHVISCGKDTTAGARGGVGGHCAVCRNGSYVLFDGSDDSPEQQTSLQVRVVLQLVYVTRWYVEGVPFLQEHPLRGGVVPPLIARISESEFDG